MVIAELAVPSHSREGKQRLKPAGPIAIERVGIELDAGVSAAAEMAAVAVVKATSSNAVRNEHNHDARGAVLLKRVGYRAPAALGAFGLNFGNGAESSKRGHGTYLRYRT